MAYDRYDPRNDRPRWSTDRMSERERLRDNDYARSSDPRGENRGFFERAGDEIASWFGDDDAEHRRDSDRRFEERGHRPGPRFSRDQDWDRGRDERDHDRGFLGSSGYRGQGGSSGGFGHRSRQTDFGNGQSFENGARPMFGGYTVAETNSDRGQDYHPMTGDYGRSESLREHGRSSHMDPHYHSWRRRQIDELDRDYDDYRSENQSRFDQDFSDWRVRRQTKRGFLSQIREHMEVVGNDDEHVGTVDRAVADRIILTKSDPESGDVHHSLSCSDIDRVEDDRVILDCSADQAKKRWRDESRSRALFEREDQGEMGPRVLERSFEGTYR